LAKKQALKLKNQRKEAEEEEGKDEIPTDSESEAEQILTKEETQDEKRIRLAKIILSQAKEQEMKRREIEEDRKMQDVYQQDSDQEDYNLDTMLDPNAGITSILQNQILHKRGFIFQP
jgi:hypothetical protein